MNKKASTNILMENVTFLIITILFMSMIFIYVANAGDTISKVEEIEAKKLALMINSAKAGTSIHIALDEALIGAWEPLEVDEKDLIKIGEGHITVRATKDTGYTYGYFSGHKVSSEIREEFGENKYLVVSIQ